MVGQASSIHRSQQLQQQQQQMKHQAEVDVEPGDDVLDLTTCYTEDRDGNRYYVQMGSCSRGVQCNMDMETTEEDEEEEATTTSASTDGCRGAGAGVDGGGRGGGGADETAGDATGIQSGLPQVSYVKAIDVWMGTCTAFVFCALLEFTFVNYMWRKLSPEILRKTLIPDGVNGDVIAKGPQISEQQEEAVAVTVVKKVILTHGDLSGHVTNKNMIMARQIDEYSRLGFPLAFALFNILYWYYYLA